MKDSLNSQIKAKLQTILQDHDDITDDEDLITSGRLNSLKTVEMANWLETTFKLNFDKCGFNLYDFESITSIQNLILSHAAKNNDVQA
jgi:acyl carrier protein